MRMALTMAYLLAAPAWAGDYPFTGTFTIAANPTGPRPEDQAICALSFFSQEKSGAYTYYVADLETFRAKKTLRYQVVDRGQCLYDEATRAETCLSLLGGAPADPSTYLHDVIEEITPDYVKTLGFDTEAHAKAYHETGVADGSFPPTGYAHCNFDPALLSAALSSDLSTLSPEDSGKLMTPDLEMLQDPLTLEIMKAAGLSKP